MATKDNKSIDELLVGDVLAQTVFSATGTVLLDQNTKLTQELIKKLDRWGILSIAVCEKDEEPAAQEPGEVSLTVEEEEEKPSEAFQLTLGTLEAEEPILWDEVMVKSPPPEDIEALEQEIEDRLAEPPPARRGAARVVPPEVAFRYDKATVREAKKVMHEVHRQTVRQVTKTFSTITDSDDQSNLKKLRHTIIQLVDNGVANRQVLSALTTLTHFDDYLLAHAVGTTVHSILTGYMMGFPTDELYELAECCLLHDIGMSRISSKTWKHPGRLTLPMQLEIQKHTVLGADLLHDTPGITRLAEYVAYQHHERYDGSGYPKGRKGLGIHEYARIIGLVDVYAAMTSARMYRERILGYETMKHVLASSGTLFDPVIVKAFLQNMALYPVGSLVELSNGSIAIVVSANPAFPYRPQVKVTRDERGADTGDGGDVIDLLSTRNLGIARPLPMSGADRERAWAAL